ncbi:hypothetical protein ANN_02126 [Periplaneta americana]|uniref:aspartate transaminase n=1 Tax=Periplaneta americana TaxID=6978 RepID=A0ABQ8TX73_PERAM|nr:hypothetical protein ANN_02126 [Periplaneta americana]
MDLREVGYDGRDWINLAQDRDRQRAYCEFSWTLLHMASPQFLQVKSESSQEQTELIDLCVLCFVDEHEDKIDLIPGMYRHEDGQPWVMPFVLNIEKKIIDDAGYNHEYVIFLGLRPFTEMVPQIVLGKNNPVIQSGRAFAVQTASGTAALRAGGELLARHANFDTFYLSDPTWGK